MKALALTLAALVAGVPVLAGIVITLLKGLDSGAWSIVLATPGVWRALGLSLWTGTASTLIALAIAHVTVAVAGPAHWNSRLRAAMLPLLAMPHLAVAIGLALALSPSGMIVRLLSPWATGFQHPPDWMTIQDPHGFALILGLVVKEAPFLTLMLLGALAQVPSERLMLTCRALGYGRLKAWFVSVAPLLQQQVRLPLAAVFVFGVTNVEMAIPLGPQTPTTFGILLWQWFTASRLELQGAAYAGTLLLLGITVSGLLAGQVAGRLGNALFRGIATSGHRIVRDGWARSAVLGLPVTVALLGVGAVAALAARAGSRMWRFPRVFPDHLDWATMTSAAPSAGGAMGMTLLTAIAVAVVGIAVTLALIEALGDSARWRRTVGVWLFVPLVVPQFAFLFGLTWLLTRLRLEGTLLAVIWSHLLFALPYTWGILAGARAALDSRYQLLARTLGSGPTRTWWTVTAPLLLRSILLAAAVALAVSTAVYLPTLFAGAGRIVTIATEAANAAASGNLRTAAVYGALQALLPLAAFATASLGAHTLYRRFRGVPR